MQIVIHTINGTYLVPPEKETSLIMWLEQNAIKAGQRQVSEQNQQNNQYTGRQLLSEEFRGEF
jgi:hypothetical protein